MEESDKSRFNESRTYRIDSRGWGSLEFRPLAFLGSRSARIARIRSRCSPQLTDNRSSGDGVEAHRIFRLSHASLQLKSSEE